MKKMMKFSILLLLISGIVVSCAEKGIQESAETNLPQDKEYERALELVKNFESSWGQTRAAGDEIYLLNTACENVGIPKEVQQTLTRSQDKAQPDSVKLYRFEFEKNGDKGFAISVGDERVNAILCYVERGSIDDTLYNEAMAEYISNLKYAVYNRLEENEKPAVETKASIKQVDRGPLMNLGWDQNWPYNYSCPHLGCDPSSTQMGRALVGCAGIATSQVLAFVFPYDLHKAFPQLSEWRKISYVSDRMSDLKEFGDFIKYIADQLGTKFGCDQSTASMKAIDNLLTKYYVTHYWKGSNNLHMGRAVNSIHSYGKPVICAGKKKRKGSSGHIWVIEGHRGWMYEGNPYEVVESKTQYWYCNWGLGTRGDGWYINYMHPKKYGDEREDTLEGTGNYHYSNDFIYIGFPAWYGK